MYGIYDGTVCIAEFATPLTVRSNKPVYLSDSMSLKRVVSTRPSQRWEIETKLMPQSITAADLFVHTVLHGNHSPFKVAMPQIYGSRHIVNRDPETITYMTLGGSSGDRVVQLSHNGVTRVVPKGVFIQFENHNKVYMVEEDMTWSGVVKIFPGLVTSVPQNTVVNAGDIVKGTFLYDLETVIGMSFIDGVLMDNGTIKLVEAL